MLSLIVVAAAAVVITNAGAAGVIDLSGPWIHTGSASEGYTIIATPGVPANFTVACVSGGCGTWKAATIGILSEATGACIVQFTGENRNHTGRVSLPAAHMIAWSDGSEWSRNAPPANITVDVVVLPHSALPLHCPWEWVSPRFAVLIIAATSALCARRDHTLDASNFLRNHTTRPR